MSNILKTIVDSRVISRPFDPKTEDVQKFFEKEIRDINIYFFLVNNEIEKNPELLSEGQTGPRQYSKEIVVFCNSKTLADVLHTFKDYTTFGGEEVPANAFGFKYAGFTIYFVYSEDEWRDSDNTIQNNIVVFVLTPKAK